MDPNSNIAEQLRIVHSIHQINDRCNPDGSLSNVQVAALASHADRLADLVEALDDWIAKGGFLPERWHRAQS